MAVSHTSPTVSRSVRVHSWLVPRMSTQNGVPTNASNAVPPISTIISAAVPAGAAPAGRRSPMRATAADRPAERLARRRATRGPTSPRADQRPAAT